MKKEKYVLYVNGELVPVCKKVYDAYYKELNHEKYLERKDKANSLLYYDQFDFEDMNFEDVLEDKTFNVEQIVETKILMEKLYEALDLLSEEERELVIELFFKEKTLTEVAKVRETSHTTISRKRRKILEKLKEILE